MREGRAAARPPAREVPVGNRWRNGGNPRAATTRKMRVVPVSAAKMVALHTGGPRGAGGDGTPPLPAREVPVGKRGRDGGDPRAAATRKMRVVPVAPPNGGFPS